MIKKKSGMKSLTVQRIVLVDWQLIIDFVLQAIGNGAARFKRDKAAILPALRAVEESRKK